MPRPKTTVSTTDEEKQANKGIGAVIHHFYTKYKNTKPDATHFKQNHGIIKTLMFPSDQFRTYTEQEVIRVIDELYLNGVVLMGLTILSWPDLCRSIIDNDQQTFKHILKNIKASQARDGVYSDKDLGDVPKGW